MIKRTEKTIYSLVAGFACLVLAACQSFSPGPVHDLVISNVAVFEAQTGTVQQAMTVAIDGDRITVIQTAAEPVRGRETLDGEGRLLVPGFVDTHTHALINFGAGDFGPATLNDDHRELLARTFLAHGTTTIADMGQPADWVPRLQSWAETPVSNAPNHVVVGGSLISDFEWNRFIPQHHRVVASPADADKTVARYQDRGVTALKLYWKLGTPEYEALSKAAAARGLNLYTHVDNGIVSINEAMSNGVRHFEHFFTLIPTAMNISAERPALKAAFGVDRPRGLDEYAAIQAFYFAHMRANAALDADLLALLDRMAANKATISLTLNNIAAAAGQSSFFTGFGPYPDRSAPQLSYRDEQRAQLKTAFLAITHYMKEAVDRGIVLRLGTDTRKGGEAALAAMIAMGENGFDMPTVFQIATINGARALGLDDDIGLVKAGHRADLVLLDASVLDDPRKLFGTKTIIKNGQVFEPKASRAEAILAQLNETRDAEAARNWAREYQDDPRFGPLQTVELETAFYSAIYAGDVTRARLTHDFVKPYLGPNDTHFPSEREINGAGYGLVNKKDMASARAVFAYNVELFPTSANVYDSLGEVCALMGDMDCAEKNYKRTLAINPDNPNAQNVLDRIKDLRTAAGS